MEKKDKILLVIAPVALVAVGYMFFGDKLFPEEVKKPDQESFTTIDAPITEGRKNRTEIYRDKYEKENGKALERNIMSDESFFGSEEIKSTEQPEESNSIYKKPDTEESFTEAQPQVKTEEKPKVIVKYVERPVTKKQVVKEESEAETQPVAEIKPARRRTGFVEGSATTSSADKVDGSEEILEEINIPVVVQDNIEVKQGSFITLRSTEANTINGIVVPKNSLITGLVNLGPQRISIAVTAIKTPSKTIPVKLKGYDLDGNEGVTLEGGVDKEIKRDVINDAITASRTIVRVPILSSTPSRIGTKKVNDPTVPVPKGLKFFLKP